MRRRDCHKRTDGTETGMRIIERRGTFCRLRDKGRVFVQCTYEESEGYVAQDIRGNYSRDDEVTVSDIQAGDLYLFSDGQLRLYFKDVEGAEIKATPVGHFTDCDDITKKVEDAYQENRDDSWGVRCEQ